MKYRDRAILAMRTAETTLREELKLIIQEAVAAEAYEDVALIARMAIAAADAIRDLTPSDQTEAGSGGATSIAPPVLAPSVTKSNGHVPEAVKPQLLTRGQLPQFFRDGERLVKIAWSKKDRAPYEHRAPRAVIDAFIAAVQKKKGEGKMFQAADVMPIKNAQSEEYPSYQSYIALNWLREVGVISKKGREGYVLKAKSATADKLDQLWTALPVVESND